MLGLFGIILALATLMWLAFRGWSILLVAPLAALVAAAVSSEPLLLIGRSRSWRGRPGSSPGGSLCSCSAGSSAN